MRVFQHSGVLADGLLALRPFRNSGFEPDVPGDGSDLGFRNSGDLDPREFDV